MMQIDASLIQARMLRSLRWCDTKRTFYTHFLFGFGTDTHTHKGGGGSEGGRRGVGGGRRQNRACEGRVVIQSRLE